MSGRFQIGDIVEILSCSNSDNQYRVGKLAEIQDVISLDRDMWWIKVEGEREEIIWQGIRLRKKGENKMGFYEETLGFHELVTGKEYRLLHGGEKDHGYVYELRNGRLFNKIRNKFSTVPFNNKVRFVESITKKFNLSTLEFDVILGPRQAKIGCQTISKDDLREFYHKLGEFYGF